MSKGACSQDQGFLMLHGSVPGPLSSQRAQEPPQGQGCSPRNCPGSEWSPAAPCLTSSPISSAELLPHLGGLQLQGHEAAFPAEVRLLGVPQLGGRAEGSAPHHRPSHCPSPQDHCAGCCGLLGCLPESGRHGHQHPRWGGGVAGGWGGSRSGLEAGKAECSMS